MKKRCVIKRVSVILTAVITLLSCSMLSSAEEIR